ncbi:unnamed protein product [Cladocopium goreaui]|uniref:Uncharacterized protein n=1 Tax=Cladocopium goreaui TaxID=2562237 RepID=A0A9P1CHW7_9DINO|nr:unnamed protein product [Cladocopium goreaui]
MAFFKLHLLLGACWALPAVSLTVPSKALWFQQKVNHFSASNATYLQRYYMDDKHWAGPGSPIFVIMGGERGIPPEMGIFWPWISEVLARQFGGLVLVPEHRFYGESLPYGPASYEAEHLKGAMTSQEALADAAELIRSTQLARNCTVTGTSGYCPVLVIGGSYSGFLAAMMRMRYPAVVDMAYASSAPLKFYSQEVGQYAYYAKVTESAEKSMKGCAAAVLQAFQKMMDFFQTANSSQIAQQFSVCEPVSQPADLADNLLFLAEQTFATLNMVNYPPNSNTGLRRTCGSFIAAAGHRELEAFRDLFLQETHLGFMNQPLSRSTCFNVSAHLPAGESATARCGDWSGCSSGRDGEMWDFQTCSFEVERIGFGSEEQMFPSHPWTMEWLKEHCMKRFAVRPQPKSLVDLWGFDEATLVSSTSRILFVNGLNDGWSVAGILQNLSREKGLIAINLPNGAHHSELSLGLEETEEVRQVRQQILAIVGQWLEEIN